MVRVIDFMSIIYILLIIIGVAPFNIWLLLLLIFVDSIAASAGTNNQDN